MCEVYIVSARFRAYHMMWFSQIHAYIYVCVHERFVNWGRWAPVCSPRVLLPRTGQYRHLRTQLRTSYAPAAVLFYFCCSLKYTYIYRYVWHLCLSYLFCFGVWSRRRFVWAMLLSCLTVVKIGTVQTDSTANVGLHTCVTMGFGISGYHNMRAKINKQINKQIMILHSIL